MSPYNLSRKVCVRNQRYYEDLDNARGTNVSWPTGSLKKSQQLASRLREALAAAGCHPDFQKYGDLRSLYKLRATRGWLEAHWMGPPEEGIPMNKMVIRPQRLEVPEATTVTGVVGAAIKFNEKADEIYCPNAIVMDESEKIKLWKWCQKSGWKYIDQFEGGLTITRRRIDPLLIYEPEEEGEEQL